MASRSAANPPFQTVTTPAASKAIAPIQLKMECASAASAASKRVSSVTGISSIGQRIERGSIPQQIKLWTLISHRVILAYANIRDQCIGTMGCMNNRCKLVVALAAGELAESIIEHKRGLWRRRRRP